MEPIMSVFLLHPSDWQTGGSLCAVTLFVIGPRGLTHEHVAIISVSYLRWENKPFLQSETQYVQ